MKTINLIVGFAVLFYCTILSAAPPPKVSEGGTKIEFTDPIILFPEGPPERPKVSPRRGTGPNEAGLSSNTKEAKKKAKAEADARAAALAKASAEEKARIKEAEGAAYELLLRLGDKPLENDSYIVDKAWDRLVGIFISPQVSIILKTLTPSEPGLDSWLDLAESKKEMLGARYLIQKDLDAEMNAQKIKAENEKALGLEPSVTPPMAPKPETQEEKRFFDGMRSLASSRSDDTRFVVDQLITRGRLSSEMPIKLQTIKSISKALAPLTPPNSCIVTRKWACPMIGGKIGDSCVCPNIGIGKGGLRPVSEFCKGATSNCRFNISFPVGTACNCAADFQMSGPIHFGNIVPRPVRP